MAHSSTFYLGIHRPSWLDDPRLADVPVFISRRAFLDHRTGNYRGTLHRAAGRYAIDSGGFTELQKFGRWTTSPAEYIAFLQRCWDEIGHFDFAAPMDWMCEPFVISGGRTDKGLAFVGTGLDVDEHLRRTVANYLELQSLAPAEWRDRIRPVIQGWGERDYVRCVGMYLAAGVDVTSMPVAVGSVCRRQDTEEAGRILAALAEMGVTDVHGFGFKIQGIREHGDYLTSSDSMAASFDGRHAGPCQHPAEWKRGAQPQSEANCLAYFLEWTRRHIEPLTSGNSRPGSLPLSSRPAILDLKATEEARKDETLDHHPGSNPRRRAARPRRLRAAPPGRTGTRHRCRALRADQRRDRRAGVRRWHVVPLPEVDAVLPGPDRLR